MPTHRLTLLYKIPRHHEFKATQIFMVITIRNFSSSFDYFSYTLSNLTFLILGPLVKGWNNLSLVSIQFSKF